ncbi:MAG TPA: hypothetical protein PKM13_06550, partial [Candidatus Bipolaricaulis anaerobius]|nr:hypothetical protein [Candidatus Bipolaricaulis anaerobius]
TDGLPIVPPTPEAVECMLGPVGRDPQEVIAAVPPKYGHATLEKIAINAVMAGCLPEYLPVVVAALEAMCEERFNLYGIQVTTHPCAPLVIVNGPIRQALDINGGYGVFGPTWRANATIGRAIRLALLNLGGAAPGSLDKATHGHPGKFSFCIAENEEESPWVPLHVERGFAREDSTVTVTAVEPPHNVNDHASVTALGILRTCAGTLNSVGSNNAFFVGGEPLVVLGPEHAATIARDGLSKADVQAFLFEHARIPLSAISEENIRQRHADLPADGSIPVARRKEDIMVVVAGGAGKQSCCLPSFGSPTQSVTRRIDWTPQS